MIGELPVRAARLAVALKCADQGERMIGASCGPGTATVRRAGEPQRDVLSHVAEAGEVGGIAMRTERDRRIAADLVDAGSRDRRVVGELRDAGDEAARQRRRPRFAAVEGGVHAAAVVVVPVVVAGDHVARVRRIYRERGFVLRGGIAADVDDGYRAAGACPAEARRAERGDGGFAAGSKQRARTDGGDEGGREAHAGSPSDAVYV